MPLIPVVGRKSAKVRVLLGVVYLFLALGADGAALIKTDSLPDNPHDTARLVADLAGQKQLPCDLVLCGDAILAAVLAGHNQTSTTELVYRYIRSCQP